MDIMVTNDVSLAVSYANLYGAVVVVGPQYTRYNDVDFPPQINVPVFIAQNISLSEVPTNPFLIISDNDTAVTSNEASAYHYMYDMSAVRGYMECGEYTTNLGFGYSFIARLTNSSVRDPAGNMGIETTIGGLPSWVSNPSYSSVDHSYIAEYTGTKVMGLPGCNDIISCGLTSNSPIQMKLNAGLDHSNYGIPSVLVCAGKRCG